jgi:EAL domain-containing protein (putative c-di-GMP-specific phosphodiesterase class I)/GGDEF domain-containing protein
MELGQGIFSESGELEALEGIILDVSDRKRAENILKYNSEYDVWTGLHNRSFLENLLVTEQITKRNVKRALIGINLSTMHILSLTYGFQYSQGLIKRAADALNALSHVNRRLFYTYENRFVFYVTGYKNKADLTAFCDDIVRILKTVLIAERIGGGIGILEIDTAAETSPDRILKSLLLASEKALATIEGDFSYSFFDEELEAQIVREEMIRLELIRVLEGKSGVRFYLQFQPIYEIKSERIVGFEALARLTSSQLGIISPVEFIPIAEKTKLIIPLGKEIIRQALRFLSRLGQNGDSEVTVAINISAIQILQAEFVDDLLFMNREANVDPSRVCLELTESVFSARYRDINDILLLIKEHGIKIAIDAFGTGYSSFARERELNVDCLKIDKFFIDKLLQINEEQAITGDIISMAHKLGHSAIAEGVEQRQQLEYLRKHGCDMIQGFYISMPLDEKDALELLGDGRNE